MSHKASILKQYRDLARSIRSFSDGQACLSEQGEDTLEMVRITISPHGGHYREGKFEFELDLSDDYPSSPPTIRCLTRVYHPNIDMIDDYSDGDVCLNLLDELFDPELTLEDYVQGLLFLFYNPNLEDPLSGAFDAGEDEAVFHRNVRRSMRGVELDGRTYDQFLPSDCESVDESDEEDIGKETTQQEHEQETVGQTHFSTTEEGNLKERERELEKEEGKVVSPHLVVKDEATGQDVIASNENVANQVTTIPGSVHLHTLTSASSFFFSRFAPSHLLMNPNVSQWYRIGLWFAVGMAVITSIPVLGLLRTGRR